MCCSSRINALNETSNPHGTIFRIYIKRLRELTNVYVNEKARLYFVGDEGISNELPGILFILLGYAPFSAVAVLFLKNEKINGSAMLKVSDCSSEFFINLIVIGYFRAASVKIKWKLFVKARENNLSQAE